MRNVSIHNLFRNQTGGFEPKGWQPEPQVRGTWSILSSCLITMLLCVWTAVHLNVPSNSGDFSQSARKVGWLVLGLVAPEMIAFTAWNQYHEAVKLTREMREVLGQDPPPSFGQSLRKFFLASVEDTKKFFRAPRDLQNELLRILVGSRSYLVPHHIGRGAEIMDMEELIQAYGLNKVPQVQHTESLPPPVEPVYMPSSPALAVERPAQPIEGRHEWTMTHSLYTVMGGFSFSPEGLPINFFRDGAQRATITPLGLLNLIKWKADVIPNLSVEHIKDKSKADGLKKLIVCLQAGRFLVSTIFRMAAGYPIALLELTTVAHCIYALLVYMFWWSKPLDVSEPTLIPARLCPELAAFYSMTSSGYGGADAESKWVDIKAHNKSLSKQEHNIGIQDVYTQPRFKLVGEFGKREELSANFIMLHAGEYLYGFQLRRNWRGLRPRPREFILLSHADVERWRLASLAIDRFGQFETQSRLDRVSRRRHKSLSTDRARNWPSQFFSKLFDIQEKDGILLWGSFILAGLSYGGIHLLAWYAPMRHPVEVKLWIISGISITFAGPIVLILLLIMTMSPKVYDRFFGSSPPRWMELAGYGFASGFGLFMTLGGYLYVLARGFLIVECFINLFYVDVHVFSVPKWTQYVPSLQ